MVPAYTVVLPQPVVFDQGSTAVAVDASSFSFSCATSVCPAVLPPAFARYLGIIFVGTTRAEAIPPTPGKFEAAITSCPVTVAMDVPLAVGVNESYTVRGARCGFPALFTPAPIPSLLSRAPCGAEQPADCVRGAGEAS